MRPDAALVRAMRWYVNHFPIAKGKGPILALLRRTLDEGLFRARLDNGMELWLRRDDIVSFLTFVRGVWEPENSRVLAKLLQAGDCFVDVGANIGYFAVLSGRKVAPGGQVVALEPMPETREWLEKNIALNGLKNVQVVGAAAAENAGELRLHLFAGETVANASEHAAGREAVQTLTVPTVALDEVMRDLPEGTVVLKVDVEGGEWGVFAGAREFLRQRRPVLMFELFPALGQEAGWQPAGLLGTLREFGYEFYISTGEALRPLRDKDLPTVESGDHIDVFAFVKGLQWHEERLARVRDAHA